MASLIVNQRPALCRLPRHIHPAARPQKDALHDTLKISKNTPFLKDIPYEFIINLFKFGLLCFILPAHHVVVALCDAAAYLVLIE